MRLLSEGEVDEHLCREGFVIYVDSAMLREMSYRDTLELL